LNRPGKSREFRGSFCISQDNWQLIADAQTSAAGTPDAKMTATVHRALAARVSWIRIRCAVVAGKLGSDFNQIFEAKPSSGTAAAA
jgi:hypothetical protein